MKLKSLEKIVRLLGLSEGSLLYDNLMIQSSRESVLRLVNEVTEGYERGLLLDLIRDAGRESVLLLSLLEYSMRKGLGLVERIERAMVSMKSAGAGVGDFGLELNKMLDDLEGQRAHVHLDMGSFWYKGVDKYKIMYEDLYKVENKDIKVLKSSSRVESQEEIEGAVLWFVGEVEEMRGGWYLELQGVVDDFLGCEEYAGRGLVIVGESRELRLLLGGSKQFKINSERVTIVELKGVKSGEDLRDLEAYTGGSRLKGQYGYARRVVIDPAQGLIVEAYGEDHIVESTEERVSELESKIRRESSVYLVEEWRKRIAKLRGVMVVVGVGGVTETEVKWRRGLIEKEIREVLSKRESGAVLLSSILTEFPDELKVLFEGYGVDEEYAYSLLASGLRRVKSLVETLSKVEVIVPQKKAVKK